LLGSPFLFGYAKPVPVNFRALRNPRSGMVWVAVAGPAMNIALAILAALDWLAMVLRHEFLPATFSFRRLRGSRKRGWHRCLSRRALRFRRGAYRTLALLIFTALSG